MKNEAEELESYFDRLWPLPRSLTGNGVRLTHDILSELSPLNRLEIPSGTAAFDWVVPPEWTAREAYIIAPDGRRFADVSLNNLHLVGYSIPFRGRLSRQDLEPHLYSLKDRPNAIPYVTSYYKRRWGFCISHQEREALPDGMYDVVVDTTLDDTGAMTIGETVLPGRESREILFSTYTCHPSMALNELSGPLVTALLCRRLRVRTERRFTYRFVFQPETIGAITYLSMHGEAFKKNLLAGYVITCVGDDGPYTYKLSRRGDCLADRTALYVLRKQTHRPVIVDPFRPDAGSDERQYCSPGFNLPVGALTRTRHGRYPEYHTSDDNKSLIDFDAMVATVDTYETLVDAFELNATYLSLKPNCEPHLEKYGLYDIAGPKEARVSAVMWVLNYADGQNDLLSIAEKSGHDLAVLASAAKACVKAGLLKEV